MFFLKIFVFADVDCSLDNPPEKFLRKVQTFSTKFRKKNRVYIFHEKYFSFLKLFPYGYLPQNGSEIERFLKYERNQTNLNSFKISKGRIFAVEFKKIFFHLLRFYKITEIVWFSKIRKFNSFVVRSGIFNKSRRRRISRW